MLQVEGLAKRYGDVLALQDLTVSVEAGQCLVLLGRNGAGKTTALRCMAGVLLPSGGMVKVDGIDAADDPAAVRARVGLMPEVPGLYERMSVRAYLDHFGAIYDIEPETRRSRIDELLEVFELTDAGDRWLGTFSKGMRQKVALIRATLHRPRLVLADEPTSALDPDSATNRPRRWIRTARGVRGSISRICRGKAVRSSSAPIAWKRPSTLPGTSESCPPAARLRSATWSSYAAAPV